VSDLVWFNEARKRWIAVCSLRRCPWFTGSKVPGAVEVAQRRHADVCPGRLA